jgi:hypothetical protein
MKVAAIKGLVERQPFRPFGVRLNNGEQWPHPRAAKVAKFPFPSAAGAGSAFVNSVRADNQ